MTEILIGLMNAPRRIQRWIALGVLGLGVLSAVWLAMLAIDHLREQTNEIEEKRFELGRLNAVLEQRPADTGTAPASATTVTGVYLDGETMPVTRARLQERINGISAQAGAVVVSINSVPDSAPDAVPLIGAAVDIQGSLKAIHDVVFQIEASEPPLLIRKALIRMTSPIQEGQLQEPLQLATSIEIYGSADPALITPIKATEVR
ncbi:type II secretion system protein GspM [Rhizobium leguminosarum]|uniref:type II secretion system protein GspM n=1 Tax=Rhizobium leguminosarum TaxID=384 RepID=UPI003F94F856